MTILIFVIVLILSMIITGYLRNYALKLDLLDIPNARSSHDKPMPRGGGIAIVITFLSAMLLIWAMDLVETKLFISLSVAGGLVAAIGIWDDRGHVPQYLRLIIHFVAVFWALWWLGNPPSLIIIENNFLNGFIATFLAAVFLVWILNLFNFMDGIDGIAGSEAIFIALSGAFFTWLTGANDVSLLLIVISASSLGFLIWNWPPAKIFMGDVGSGFLGITLGILAYSGILNGVSIWIWLIIFGVFIVDASVTLFSRYMRGDLWYNAHCSHTYQRASRIWGHTVITITVILVNLLWLLPLAFLANNYISWAWLIMLIAYTPLIITAFILGAGKPDEVINVKI